jgi:hypothetical protein
VRLAYLHLRAIPLPFSKMQIFLDRYSTYMVTSNMALVLQPCNAANARSDRAASSPRSSSSVILALCSGGPLGPHFTSLLLLLSHVKSDHYAKPPRFSQSDSFCHFKKLTPAFSSDYALFDKNTRGGVSVCPTDSRFTRESAVSNLQSRTSKSDELTHMESYLLHQNPGGRLQKRK